MYQNKRKNLLFLGMAGGMGLFIWLAYLLARKPEILEKFDRIGNKLYAWIASSEIFTTIFTPLHY